MFRIIDHKTSPGEIFTVVMSVSFAAFLISIVIPQSSFIFQGQIAAGILYNRIKRVNN